MQSCSASNGHDVVAVAVIAVDIKVVVVVVVVFIDLVVACQRIVVPFLTNVAKFSQNLNVFAMLCQHL